MREVCSGNVGGRPAKILYRVSRDKHDSGWTQSTTASCQWEAADFTNDNDYNYEHVKDGYVRSNVTLGVQWSRANNPFTCKKASSEFYQFEAQYHRSGDKNMIGKVNSIQWNLIWDSIDNSAHSTATSQHENLKNFCKVFQLVNPCTWLDSTWKAMQSSLCFETAIKRWIKRTIC